MTGTPHLQDDHRAHPLRVWLAALAVLVLALLPGPHAPQHSPDLSHLIASEPALTGHQGRELVSRQDAAQFRPLPPAALPPGALPPPPRSPQILLLAGTKLALPQSRSPPTARARAPPLT